MSLLKELKRRHVLRMAVAYIAIGWVVMQFASIVTPTLDLPDWVLTALFLIGLFGFPLTVWLTWTYQLTEDGIQRAADVTEDETSTGITRGKLNRVIITLLTIALILILAERLILMRQAGDNAEAPSSLTTP